MTNITIGLRDSELLKYFNQIHAALKEAEGDYDRIRAATSTGRNNTLNNS